MRVGIFEDAFRGHHLLYVRYLVEALNLRGIVPTLYTSHAAVESAAFAEHLSRGRVHFEVFRFALDDTARGGARVAARARALVFALRARRPQHLFIPYLDGLVYGLDALLSSPVSRCRKLRAEGILFGYGDLAPGMRGWIKQQRLRRVISSRRVVRVHHLDDTHAESLASRTVRAKIGYLPDPAPSISVAPGARRRLSLPTEQRLLLCIGVLTARKSVARLIRLATSRHWRRNHALLLAGVPDDHVSAVLAQPDVQAAVAEGRILCRLGTVPAADFPDYFVAADAVAAVYPNHKGSSGIVLHAAAAGTPLVGTPGGWIGRNIDRHGLGVLCDARDDEDLLRAIESAFAMGAMERRAAFLAEHSEEAFKKRLLAELDDRLHQEP